MENFKFSKNKFHLSYFFWLALWSLSYFFLEKNSFIFLNILLFIAALVIDFLSEVLHGNSNSFDTTQFHESNDLSIENNELRHTEDFLIAK